jgi:hypothetical protein
LPESATGALPCYPYSDGTLPRKNKDHSVVRQEAGRHFWQDAPYRASRTAARPDDHRRGTSASSERSLQPSRPLRLRNSETVRRVFADTLYWLAIFCPAMPGRMRRVRPRAGPNLRVIGDGKLNSSIGISWNCLNNKLAWTVQEHPADRAKNGRQCDDRSATSLGVEQ